MNRNLTSLNRKDAKNALLGMKKEGGKFESEGFYSIGIRWCPQRM